jgi:ABC-type polysaccharide/polyol phosphate transport system ATPase subunit
MKPRPPVVKLTNISKKYYLNHEKPTLTEQIIKRTKTEEFKALDKINLTIYQGEKVGVIGLNGAGKTTLLKIISDITTPTTGQVVTVGRKVSLIELEAGFHPDLSGYENIKLNGLIVGMTKQEIHDQFENICKFANINTFLDAPLYTYSEGMKLRLGFSIAVHTNPDILILDENISAGDIKFQQKSKKKIEEFFKEGKTVIVSSHWYDFIEQQCSRALLLDQGHIIADGKPSSIIQKSKTNKI